MNASHGEDIQTVLVGERRPIAELERCLSIADHPNDEDTKTFKDQIEVEETVLGIYEAYSRCDTLDSKKREINLLREKHGSFLRKGLTRLSESYEVLDASRPWFCYWILHSMNLLELKLSKEESMSIARFIDKCQDKVNGGFGGGPGQFPHLAATYAAINALICLGLPEAFAVIDRELLLKFIKSMKLSNGSFKMHWGGEVDVRAVYCAVVAASLTNLYSDELFYGTGEWISRCQTYEGGFAGFPSGEAHGGYTFCGLAALVLLKKDHMCDRDLLLKWLTFRQMSMEGGFQGRTNKLVDGCYSFWQGACFCLLGEDGILRGPNTLNTSNHCSWLFSQLALQEYILICCQHSKGGLIDKPGKQQDYYHTCYTLSGLSIAQHAPNNSETFLENQSCRLREIHPVYNLTLDVVKKSEEYFYETALTSSVSEVKDDFSGVMEGTSSKNQCS